MARRSAALPQIEPVDFGDLVSVKQLAEYFGVTQRSVERYIAAGELPAPRKIFNQRYFTKAQLTGWLGGIFAPVSSTAHKSSLNLV